MGFYCSQDAAVQFCSNAQMNQGESEHTHTHTRAERAQLLRRVLTKPLHDSKGRRRRWTAGERVMFPIKEKADACIGALRLT